MRGDPELASADGNRTGNPVGVILAGGQATRMGGGDKGLLLLGGRALLDHIIERVRPQVSVLALSANGDPARFARWGLPVVPDSHHGRGPLAGVLAGISWARRHHPDATGIVTVPTDTPFLPRDLVDRLRAARAHARTPIALAASGGRLHPVIGLWPLSLEAGLAAALAGGEYRVGAWALAQGAAKADYPVGPIDPFLNLNRPAELAEAERRLAGDPTPGVPR